MTAHKVRGSGNILPYLTSLMAPLYKGINKSWYIQYIALSLLTPGEFHCKLTSVLLPPFDTDNIKFAAHIYFPCKEKRGRGTSPYIGCAGRNVPDFGRMFLKLKYTDITKNTYIRS